MFLYVPSTIEIQVQVDGSGLDVVMSQVIFDMGDGVSPIEHIHSPGMTKAVYGVNNLETFRRKGLCEIFFTNSIDAVAGEFLTALIDKKAILIHLLWGDTIFFYIEL
jgi:hypothetical protein